MMKVYKGKKSNLKVTSLVLLSFIALILLIFFGTKRGFFAWSVMILLFLMCIPTYKGMILRITMDDKKLRIIRPFSWQTLNLSKIAFCAVHEIGEGRSTLFVFTKYKLAGKERVKGIKTDIPFEEVAKVVSESGKINDFKINFSKAFKIPVSLVENGDELKEKLLEYVDGHYYIAVNN